MSANSPAFVLSLSEIRYICPENKSNTRLTAEFMDYTLMFYMEQRLKQVSQKFHRYLYPSIHWDARLIGLTGPRGVGKSTMMLQYLLEHRHSTKMLYISADHTYFSTHTLIETAEEFIREGGEWLCIDEIHKYQGWSHEIKQLYDMYPELRIAFTGSSVLDINRGEADLSRRAVVYRMQGLSFREYLVLFHNIHSSVYSLDEILEGGVIIPGIDHPLPLFKEYLKNGYYPFALEGDFDTKIQQVVSQTVESDIPQYADMKAATARKIKQLLALIAESAPYKPNIETLATKIQASRNNIPDYLTWLERAGLIGQLRDDTGGLSSLGKVEKVFLDNPSLIHALAAGGVNIGNVRETFFYNQMRVMYELTASKLADFRIGNITFEIGGRGKSQRQLAGADRGYVVKDDIEIAIANIIPLYHFGFTY